MPDDLSTPVADDEADYFGDDVDARDEPDAEDGYVVGQDERPPSTIDEVHDVLDVLIRLVEGARSMPMSASCVVNRADVLGLLEDLRTRLPQAMDEAQELLGDRSAVVEDGRREAERIIADAREERLRLVEQTEVMQAAREESHRVLDDAHTQSEGMRNEVEDYVDAKLANFEIVLTKTLEAVERGRQKLAGRHELDDLADQAEQAEPFTH
jgi:F0F1-type ATP synthase membrane subunit b/b'